MHGAVYELVQERYLDRSQGWPNKRLPLQIVAKPLSYWCPESPRSLDEYRNEPARWPKIVGLAPAGMLIRFERMEHHRYPTLDDWWEALGVVVSGPFSGREVHLGWISGHAENSSIPRVNPDELRRVR